MDNLYFAQRTVKIYDLDRDLAVATGTILSGNGHILTVYHAISSLNEESISVQIIDDSIHSCKVVFSKPELDLVILQSDTLSSKQWVNIAFEKISLNQDLIIYGYPGRDSMISHLRYVKLTGYGVSNSNGFNGELGCFTGYSVTPGMSGGLVALPGNGNVIGVIKGIDKNLRLTDFTLKKLADGYTAERLDDLFIPIHQLSSSNSFNKIVSIGSSDVRSASRVDNLLTMMGIDYKKESVNSKVTFFSFKLDIDFISAKVLILCGSVSSIVESLYDRDFDDVLSNHNNKYVVADTILEKQKIAFERFNIEYVPTDNVYNNLIKYDQYVQSTLTNVINHFKGIDLYDVPGSLIINGNKQNIDSIYTFLVDWVFGTSDVNNIILLGKFGSGKTVALLRIFKEILSRYESSQILPFYFKLRRVSSLSFKEQVSSIISNAGGLKIFNDKVFQDLDGRGKLVFLLDGFDEMPLNGGLENVRNNATSIAENMNSDSKVIISCREEYFSAVGGLDEILKLDSLNSYKESSSCGILYIDELPTKFIDKELSQKSIVVNTALKELLRRPFFYNEYVLSKEIAIDGIVDHYGLTPQVVTNRLKREVKKFKTLSKEQITTSLIEVASVMLNSDQSTVNRVDVERVVKSTIMSRSNSELFRAYLDLTNSSILIPVEGGNKYEFSHKIFYDYFSAKAIVKFLRLKEFEKCHDLISSRRIEITLAKHISKLDATAYEFLKLLHSTSTIDGCADSDFCGGNIISILKEMEFDFKNKDFSSLRLLGANLSGLNLTNSKFVESDLYDASLGNTITDNVDMTGANLEAADFKTGKSIYSISSLNDKFVVGSTKNDVSVYSLVSGNLITTVGPFDDFVHKVLLSNVHKVDLVIAGMRGGSIVVYDSNSNLIASLHLHKNDIRDIQQIGKSTFVAVSSNGELSRFSLNSSFEVKDIEIQNIGCNGWDLEYDSGDNIIYVCGRDGKVILVNQKDLGIVDTVVDSSVFSFSTMCFDSNMNIVLGNKDGNIIIVNKYDGSKKMIKVSNYDIKVIRLFKKDIIVGDGIGNLFNVNIQDVQVAMLNDLNHNDAIADITIVNDSLIVGDASGKISIISDQKEHLELSERFESNYFSCKGLNLSESKGLSLARKTILSQMGAKI